MVAASTISTIQFAGVTARGSAGASALYCLREPNVGYITFGLQNSTAAALTKLLGNTTVEVGETFSFEAEVPVQSFK
jgi:hypothetical protein